MLIALAAGLAMPPATAVAPARAEAVAHDPVARAIRAALAADPDAALSAYYRARGFRPVWVQGRRLRPDVAAVPAVLARADEDELNPRAYRLEGLRRSIAEAQAGRPQALAQAELALSRTVGRWAVDLHTPKAGGEMIYADPAVAPRIRSPQAALEAVAEAPSVSAGLAAIARMNPIYLRLRAALAQARRDGKASEAARLAANLERARALPAEFGDRYLLIDVAAQQLELWDGGRLVQTMPVVVGKRRQPTPQLAGLVRFAVLNPYWHMPPDLAAERVAPAVLRAGPEALSRQGLELVSDFSPDATPLDPASVDWRAVAAGREAVHLRQRPGAGNMMGQVKFIFPNRLGVYLHDTPLKGLFAGARRAESAGCVRLSDAPGLARRLLGTDVSLAGSGAPEERVDLPEPVPIYLVYLTRRPTDGGAVEARADIYGRDAALMARLATPARPR